MGIIKLWLIAGYTQNITFSWLSIYPSIYLSSYIYLSFSIYLVIYLSNCQSIYLYIYLPIYLPFNHIFSILQSCYLPMNTQNLTLFLYLSIYPCRSLYPYRSMYLSISYRIYRYFYLPNCWVHKNITLFIYLSRSNNLSILY